MLGLRVTPEMKQRLDAAAAQSGRSQSQEAELRLERSFERAGFLTEALTMKYGRNLAGILQAVGNTMQATAFGHTMLTGGTATRLRAWPPDVFTDDQASLEVGLLAGVAFLALLWPQGSAKSVATQHRRMALVVAASDVADLADDLPKDLRAERAPAMSAELEAIRALLTPEVLAHVETHGTLLQVGAWFRAIADLADEAMDIKSDEPIDAVAQAAGRRGKERKP